MPTISFDRDIILNEQAGDKLLDMLSEERKERKEKIEIEDIDIGRKLARGKELLESLIRREI